MGNTGKRSVRLLKKIVGARNKAQEDRRDSSTSITALVIKEDRVRVER